jgi:hypothetical protein
LYLAKSVSKSGTSHAGANNDDVDIAIPGSTFSVNDSGGGGVTVSVLHGDSPATISPQKEGVKSQKSQCHTQNRSENVVIHQFYSNAGRQLTLDG